MIKFAEIRQDIYNLLAIITARVIELALLKK